jgi:hypothetical protein
VSVHSWILDVLLTGICANAEYVEGLDKDIPIAKKIVKTKIIILTKFKGEHLKANMIAEQDQELEWVVLMFLPL